MAFEDAELEAIVWCPKCKADKGEIRRVPTKALGVFENVCNPSPLPKKCECGENVERKP